MQNVAFRGEGRGGGANGVWVTPRRSVAVQLPTQALDPSPRPNSVLHEACSRRLHFEIERTAPTGHNSAAQGREQSERALGPLTLRAGPEGAILAARELRPYRPRPSTSISPGQRCARPGLSSVRPSDAAQ